MITKSYSYKLVPNDKLDIYYKDQLVLSIRSCAACEFSINDFSVFEEHSFKSVIE